MAARTVSPIMEKRQSILDGDQASKMAALSKFGELPRQDRTETRAVLPNNAQADHFQQGFSLIHQFNAREA
ncbi:MAG: hypothetical protein IPI44_12765 [Sulfuritalea sp.]|nr:hypothetical protein [Sulfuritalea sp.]